ncbi:hypothetical protein [Levilactobacillus mulengensis]|uniref:hypothetical protein n=1 Tax=Levilactobacillus mulengensis TaxID=2486025 RepID=UPI000F7A9BB0|nr:hypothetical protein [Levilactobacillus mulengensis]
MKIIKNSILVVISLCFGLLLWGLSQSASSTGLSTLEQPYNITSTSKKFTPNEINQRLEDFANHHQVNLVKAFWIPTTNDHAHQSFYVLGTAKQFSQNQIPKSSLASRSEFLTSDLRYPLYVFGRINPQSMQQELKSLGLGFSRSSENWLSRIMDFLFENDGSIFLALTLLLLFLTLVIRNFKALRAANIQLLQGLTKWTIFKRTLVRDQSFFLACYTLVCGLLTISLFWTHHLGTFWLTAFFALLLYLTQLLVSLTAGLIWTWSYRPATILPTIKGHAKSKLTLMIVLVVKVVTELIVLFTLLSLGQQLLTNQAIKKQVGTWSSLPTRYSPSLALNITAQEQANEDKQTYQLVTWAAHHHGLISNYAGYNAADERPTLDFNDYSDVYNGGNVLIVNAEYLRRNSVKSQSGQHLHFANNDPTTHILLPEKLARQQQKLTHAYIDQLGLQHMSAKVRTQTHLLQDHQHQLTYNPDGLDLGYYDASVPDPVIVVVSPQSLGGDNENADRLWNSMLSQGAFSLSDYHQLNRQLTTLGLYKNIGGYTNIKSYAGKLYQAQREKVFRLTSILALLIALFLFECVLTCALYLGIYQQAHAIRLLAGQSLLKVHYKFATLLIGLIAGELALTLLVTSNYRVVLSYYLVAGVLTLLTLFLKAKRSVSHLKSNLKGDS